LLLWLSDPDFANNIQLDVVGEFKPQQPRGESRLLFSYFRPFVFRVSNTTPISPTASMYPSPVFAGYSSGGVLKHNNRLR